MVAHFYAPFLFPNLPSKAPLKFDILYLTFGIPNIYNRSMTLYAFLCRLMEVKISTVPFVRRGAATKENATLHCRESPFNPWLAGNTLMAETFGTRKHLLTLSRAKRRHKTEAITYYLFMETCITLLTHCVKCATIATL
jgi:hypothetical protein